MKRILAIGCLLVAFSSCYYDKADKLYVTPKTDSTGTTTCDTSNVTYSGTIQNIVARNCTVGCHDAASLGGGYELDVYAGLVDAVQNGRLLDAIHHNPGVVAMPQNAPQLDACTINKIVRWVNEGMPNN